MATVYIVTTGSYSDYRINGVFSTEDKATQYAKFVDGDVEPFEVDGAIVPNWYDPRLSVFACSVFGSDPSQEVKAAVISADWVGIAPGSPDAINTVYEGRGWDGCGHVPALRVNVQARDKAHAIKIAAERFAEYKAHQAGVA